VFKRGVSPFFIISPSPLKERGIKGVRLVNNMLRETKISRDSWEKLQ